MKHSGLRIKILPPDLKTFVHFFLLTLYIVFLQTCFFVWFNKSVKRAVIICYDYNTIAGAHESISEYLKDHENTLSRKNIFTEFQHFNETFSSSVTSLNLCLTLWIAICKNYMAKPSDSLKMRGDYFATPGKNFLQKFEKRQKVAGFYSKNFSWLFCFLANSSCRYISNLFARETNLKKKHIVSLF